MTHPSPMFRGPFLLAALAAAGCSAREGSGPGGDTDAGCTACDGGQADATADAPPDAAHDTGATDGATDGGTDGPPADARPDAADGGPPPGACVPRHSSATGKLVGVWDDEASGRRPALAIYDVVTGWVDSLVLGPEGCCEYGLARGADTLGVVHNNAGAIGFTLVDVSSDPWSVLESIGVTDGSTGEFSGYGREPDVVWTGSAYLVYWLGLDGVYQQKISAEGALDGTPIRVVETNPGWELFADRLDDGTLAVAWTGSPPGLTALAGLFAVVREDGTTAHGPTQVDEGNVSQLRMVAAGTEFVASYVDEAGLSVVRLDDEATLIARTFVGSACLSSSDCNGSSSDTYGVYGGSTLAWNGCETAVLFTDNRRGASYQRTLFLNALDKDGTLVREEELPVVTEYPNYVNWPALGWDARNDRWGMSWNDVTARGVVYAAATLAATALQANNEELSGVDGIRRDPRLVFVPTP